MQVTTPRVSDLIKASIKPLLVFFVFDIFAVIIQTVLHHPARWGIDPQFSKTFTKVVGWEAAGLPFSGIGALGGALGIFLGFRNGAAYGRWWEARKIWGAMINDSRSWCRQSVAWFENVEGEDAKAIGKELVDRHMAFVHGLYMHLRLQPNFLPELAKYLSKKDQEYLSKVPNIPTALLIMQGKRIMELQRKGAIGKFHQVAMDKMLTRFSDIHGKCERIKNTPLPKQYVVIPQWGVLIYGCVLPFGLVGHLGWAAVPLSVLITFVFLEVEVTGRALMDPFENKDYDTPMAALAVVIERDLKAAIEEPIPEKLAPNSRGILMLSKARSCFAFRRSIQQRPRSQLPTRQPARGVFQLV